MSVQSTWRRPIFNGLALLLRRRMVAIWESGKRYLLSFCSLLGLRSGMMILFRSVRVDVTLLKSILLLFNRNSIPPVALLVGNDIGFVCTSLRMISWVFGARRGVIVASERTVGGGENKDKTCGEDSSLDDEESRRILVRLTGEEKLVLIVNGGDFAIDVRFDSAAACASWTVGCWIRNCRSNCRKVNDGWRAISR